jgi:hypothetical protein
MTITKKKRKEYKKVVDRRLCSGPVCLLESSFLLKSKFRESEFRESELFSDVW